MKRRRRQIDTGSEPLEARVLLAVTTYWLMRLPAQEVVSRDS